ncbi:isocitrate lyase/phosphoenolpyruvate mutase family protein [Serratia sp. M24T3]|uniref:isocitrate lyase/PEP mutase family protein n=1 Tax=Serratia sp. M24T3 TaxID=932213 RepID=UPI00025B93A4|nr:isocitrate lyase/phosphoenolpyruvate mutase family protein [Serratia sp. M24T3]EIC84385.1 hypothetical protein SPM24T3_11904 [Serratia sp. M24T3]
MNQENKTIEFRNLHSKANPLILYNIWDVGSAQAVATGGAKAIATGSWALAAAQGYQDGEEMPFSILLQTAKRIAETVNLPLTIDFETGYGASKCDNLKALLQVGVSGINFEDQLLGQQTLNSVNNQCRDITALVKVAEFERNGLFINARTDVFLQQPDVAVHPQLMTEAKKRILAYQEAGADGIFVPGLTHPQLIAELCDFSPLPINIMMNDRDTSLSQFTQLGVSRISFGPYPFISLMEKIKKQSRVLYQVTE